MKKLAIALSLIGLATLVAACGSKTTDTGKVIKSAPAGNNLTVALATSDGVLKHGNSEFTLTFTDSSGKPVDVGAVALTFHMPQMGTMAEMNDAATFTTTDTPGVYRGKADIEVAGEWQVRITYDGPKGRGQASFPVTAQ
jgi:nitrogen fixation protein FixH